MQCRQIGQAMQEFVDRLQSLEILICLVQLIDRIWDVYFLVYQKTLFFPCDTIHMLSGNAFRPLRYDTRDTIVLEVAPLVCNADLFLFQDSINDQRPATML